MHARGHCVFFVIYSRWAHQHEETCAHQRKVSHQVIDSQVRVLGLRLDVGFDHWIVLRQDHEGYCKHNRDSTGFTHVNQHEYATENHESAEGLDDVLEDLFVSHAVADLVLGIGEEHPPPRMKEGHVELGALAAHLEAGVDDSETEKDTR